MGPVAAAMKECRQFGEVRSVSARSPHLIVARLSKPSEPRQVDLPSVVAMTRARVFELAADAHAVSSSLRGLGLGPQVATLDRMVADLEACLVAQARDVRQDLPGPDQMLPSEPTTGSTTVQGGL